MTTAKEDDGGADNNPPPEQPEEKLKQSLGENTISVLGRRRLASPFVRRRYLSAARRDYCGYYGPGGGGPGGGDDDDGPRSGGADFGSEAVVGAGGGAAAGRGESLARATRDAGLHAFGTVAVEVWVMNPSITKLERPPGGLWVDPSYIAACEAEERVDNSRSSKGSNSHFDALARLLDEGRTDYAPPLPLGPGVGLPGALWAETAEVTVETAEKWGKMDGKKRETELERIDVEGGVSSQRTIGGSSHSVRSNNRRSVFQSVVSFKLGRKTSSRRVGRGSTARSTGRGAHRGASALHLNPSADRRRVVWREVGPLALDPDQPYNPRLVLLARSGLGLAAGVRFVLPGAYRGVVIYYARPTADRTKLRSRTNELYLRRAADAIGAVAALEEPRAVCVDARREEGRQAWEKAKTKLRALHVVGGDLGRFRDDDHDSIKPSQTTQEGMLEKAKHKLQAGAEAIEDLDEEDAKRLCAECTQSIKNYLVKCRGGGNNPPPTFSNRETLFTFLGCAVTILVLSHINSIGKQNGGRYLVMGPFGALVTLLYGLTAAPASQPRNALIGQAVSMTIAVAVSYSTMPDYAKETVATSVAVAVMVRCGITHPPAGAAALLFSTGDRDWTGKGLNLLGNVLAIAVAVLFNNLNNRRQYPTFWAVGYFWKRLYGRFCRKKKEDGEVEEKGEKAA